MYDAAAITANTSFVTCAGDSRHLGGFRTRCVDVAVALSGRCALAAPAAGFAVFEPELFLALEPGRHSTRPPARPRRGRTTNVLGRSHFNTTRDTASADTNCIDGPRRTSTRPPGPLARQNSRWNRTGRPASAGIPAFAQRAFQPTRRGAPVSRSAPPRDWLFATVGSRRFNGSRPYCGSLAVSGDRRVRSTHRAMSGAGTMPACRAHRNGCH